MGKKKNKNLRSNHFTIEVGDPGLGFSPYQVDKGMAYEPSPKDKTRQKRRQWKQKNRPNHYEE